jgi:hypothetical protein
VAGIHSGISGTRVRCVTFHQTRILSLGTKVIGNHKFIDESLTFMGHGYWNCQISVCVDIVVCYFIVLLYGEQTSLRVTVGRPAVNFIFTANF